MYRLSCAVIAAALLIGGCTDPLADRVSRDDRAILDAVVAVACKLEVQKIVISDLPAAPPAASPGELHFGLDLARRPAYEARWPRRRLCGSVRVVADRAIRLAFAKESASPPRWTAFGEAFDGADNLLRVSLPVYAEDGRRAVVYVAGTCPYTCGAGFFHELRREGPIWVITRSEVAWRS